MRTCRGRSLLARISSDVDVGAKVTDTDVSDVLPGVVAVNTHAAATVCLVLAILVIPTQVAIQFFSYSVMHRGMVRVAVLAVPQLTTTASSDCIWRPEAAAFRTRKERAITTERPWPSIQRPHPSRGRPSRHVRRVSATYI